MKIPRQKITANQQHQLLQVYLHMGAAASADLAREYGVSPEYATKHASELGLQPTRKFNGSGKISNVVDHADPRWLRAIAIGPVIA